MLVRKTLGNSVIILLPFLTFVFWLTAFPIENRFLDLRSSFYSVGQLCGLLGITLFAETLFLNTRLKILEVTFGGLNKVFPVHHRLGKITFFLILFHPTNLLLSNLTVSLNQALNFILHEPLAFYAGPVALIILSIILIITLYVKIPYHIWRFIHQFVGVAFIVASFHLLKMGSDLSGSTFLKSYIYFILALGLSAYFYRTVLGKLLTKKYPYTIEKIVPLSNDVLELVLTPRDKKINYRPGQFVFIKTATQKFFEEQHPFSMISSPAENQIRLAVKIVGDFTGTLKDIPSNTPVKIEGPYGKFGQTNSENDQIWIAGGIGLAPFLSLLTALDPKKKIDFYYSVPEKSEAIYLHEIKKTAPPNFNFFLWETKIQGRLNPQAITERSPNTFKSEIFICGPIPMIESFTRQFIAMGIPKTLIKSEEFRLAP